MISLAGCRNTVSCLVDSFGMGLHTVRLNTMTLLISAVQCSLLSQGSMASSQVFDKPVVSPALLLAIDVNKPKPFDPTFCNLVPPEWLLPSECKKVTDKDNENNSFQPPSSKKPRPSLSLKKKSSSKRFSEPVTSPQCQNAAKGVVPTNAKLSNKWDMHNLNAWVKNRNEVAPDNPVTCS